MVIKFFRMGVLVLASFSSVYPSLWAAETLYNPAGQYQPSEDTAWPARTVILGVAFAGVADDASALFLNPAGLADLDRSDISLTSDLGNLEAIRETALAGWELSSGLGLGFSAAYLGFGTLEGRDNSGNATAGYGADQWTFQAGGGMEVLKNLSMGAGLQFSSESLANASYLDFRPDVSALLVFAHGWRLGLDYAFSGWGTWPGTNVSTLTAGLSWEKGWSPDIRVLAAFGGLFQSDQTDRLQGGMEVSYQSSLFARAGYEFEPNGEAPSVLSMGAGFVLAGLTLDYAYIPYGDVLGSTHRFSLSFPLSAPADQGLEFKTPEASQGKPGFPAVASALPSLPVSEETLPGSSPVSAGSPSGPASAGNPGSPAPPTMAATFFSSAPQEASAASASPTPLDNLVIQFSIPSDLGDQAKMMESQGHYPQALGLYLQALKQKPENYHLWWGLGHVYEKLGRRDYAVYCYKRVLQLDPSQKALADWVASYEQARSGP